MVLNDGGSAVAERLTKGAKAIGMGDWRFVCFAGLRGVLGSFEIESWIHVFGTNVSVECLIIADGV